MWGKLVKKFNMRKRKNQDCVLSTSIKFPTFSHFFIFLLRPNFIHFFLLLT